MANSAFTPAVLTVSGSSSTSSGEKNYVTATDGNASGLWTSSTSPTVTISTSTSTIPDNITKASSLAIAWVSGTTGYARYRFTLDQADYGKKFKIQWDQVYGTAGHWTLQVWSNTASDYTGTSTQLTVQTSAVPGITGTFTTSVDMPGSSAPYIEIRIVASSTSATTIYLNSILMGPGTITQGAAISEWQTFTVVANNISSSGTNALSYGRYRRIGSAMELNIVYRCGSTGGSSSGSQVSFNVPDNWLIDTNIAQGVGGGAIPIGVATWYDSSAAIFKTIFATWGSSSTIVFNVSGTGGGLLGTDIGANQDDRIAFTILIPISQWAGGGTVNLGAGAQVEWAYNTSTSATVSDTTSFGYGPSGNTFGSITSALQRRVRFQYPIQNDDLITVEASEDRVKWFTVSGFCFNNSSTDRLMEYAVYNGKTYGVGSIALVNSTDVDVAFGAYAVIDTASATYGANGTAWSLAWGARYWRVRKAKASSPVGFGLAGTDGSAGLYKPGLAPGQPNGSAIAAGYIGEVITSSLSRSSATSLTSASFFQVGSVQITLTPGVWLVSGVLGFTGTSTAVTQHRIGYSTSTSSKPDGTDYDNGQAVVGSGSFNLNNQDFLQALPSRTISVSANTTYYLVGYSVFSGGTSGAYGRLTAVRIA